MLALVKMTITTRMALLRRLARTKRRPSASEGVSIAVPLSFGVSRLLVEADNNTHLLFQNKLPICHRSFSLASSSYYCETHFQEEEEVPLISLDNVSLDYCTKKKKQTQQSKAIHANLRINRPQRGGHVLLGPNGSGKSLLSNALAQGFQEHRKAMKDADIEDPNTVSPEYFQKGSMAFSSDKMWHAQAMTHVSFESHEALIQPDEDGNILSVQKAITGGGNLNKAAQFLVVRFGLYPFLHREVNTLSTGEVRKVLLVKALANRPRLLVLDNAFDGLDVPSRDNLKELVSKTLNGFRPDILVQAVDAKTTAHTQIFMLTHRSEEIVDEISTVHYFENGELVTKDRKEDSGDRLLLDALQILEGPKTTHDVLQQAWKDPNLPSTDEISDWWKMERQSPEKYTNDTSSGPLVHCENLQIQRGDSVLLSDLNWNVQPGQHWWVAGGNGQGT